MLTQRELAVRLGVSRDAIAQVEAGRSPLPARWRLLLALLLPSTAEDVPPTRGRGAP
jgi:transcriptional regulator with XRE-family HTH domain